MNNIPEKKFDKIRDNFLNDMDKMSHIKAVFDLSVKKNPIATNQTNTDKSLKDIVDDESNIIDEELIKLIDEESGRVLEKKYLSKLDEADNVLKKTYMIENLINGFKYRISTLNKNVESEVQLKKEYELANKFLNEYKEKLHDNKY